MLYMTALQIIVSVLQYMYNPLPDSLLLYNYVEYLDQYGC